MKENEVFESKSLLCSKIFISWSLELTSAESLRKGEIGKQLSPLNVYLFDEEKPSPWYLSVHLIISAKETPRPQMSMAWSYYLFVKMISGALYHLELTAHVMLLFYLLIRSFLLWIFLDTCSLDSSGFLNCSSLSTLGKVLARPRSQYMTLHEPSIRMFPGLMSLWITPAEWRNFNPHSILYRMIIA